MEDHLPFIEKKLKKILLEVMVQPGQTVAKGEGLLILEAMKMENMLKAEEEGIIKSVNVSVGDAVEKNNVLIDFE